MRTIRMIVGQPVRTATGDIYLHANEEYTSEIVSDENMQSLIGRGMAVEVNFIGDVKLDRSALEKKSLKDLRALVTAKGDKGANLLTKDRLIDILAPVLVEEGIPIE
jgi:hypothetical protein